MTKLTTYLRRFSPHYRNAFLAALFFLLFTFALCWVFYYSAWLCDDAFITFRSIKHFLNGYGIRWNISDRLQTFTHPLWFLLLSFFSWLTGELYFTTITLSFVFTFLSLSLIILAFGRNYLKSLSLLTVLLLSKSFVDFSSSGLENPLSHFLIAFFLICFLYRAKKPWLLYGCFIISGLGVLTRFDLSLLFFPALLYLIYEYRSLRIIGIACFAFTPLFLWLCFSLFYFGSFFPSPAYAKLGIALPVWDVCKQGIAYYIGTFKRDPIILPTIFISLFVVLISRNRKHIIASLGLILYLLYILRVGGDFMSGRFFTTSLIFATVMLIPFFEQLRLRWGLALSLVIFLISLTAEYPVMKNGPDLKSSLFDALDKYAVADERAFYFPSTGLSATSNAQKKRSRQMYRIAIEPRTVTGVMRVEEKTSVGQSGFFASPDLHILDRYAICDPLLSRVPTRYYPKFRPGHCLRQVPNGYKETLLSGTNVLEDPDLALYCERIKILTQGPLFSLQRFKTIVEFQTGKYDSLIHKRSYQFPDIQKFKIDYHETLFEGEKKFKSGGLQLSWDTPSSCTAIEVDVRGGSYYLVFLKGNSIVGSLPETGLSAFENIELDEGNNSLSVPWKISRRGYNSICVIPMDQNATYSLLNMRLKKQKQSP